MALIALAVYDTIENKRSRFTRETLDCLRRTVNPAKHRVFVVDNASCEETHEIYRDFPHFEYIYNVGNIGTAEAINKAWKRRKPGEHAIKMDNDVVIHCQNWADLMEETIDRDPGIGILGLKRKDLDEKPEHPTSFFQSSLRMVPHVKGQRWLIVEDVRHVMGTCTMYNSALLDKIGYLMQPGLYGMDDSLACARCYFAGYQNSFLHGIEIDHIDPGGSDYSDWKIDHATKYFKEYQKMVHEMKIGMRPLYYDPEH